MTAIVPVEHGGGHGGKKGMGKNQKMLLYGGGLAVIGALLIFKRQAPASNGGGGEAVDYQTNYPTLTPNDSLVQEQMNTMIGHQEEMFNSFLEATGQKEPEVVNKLSTTYSTPEDAMRTQKWLIGQGAGSTYIEKKHMNGWLGERDYYIVNAYGKDKEQMAELSADGVKAGQWAFTDMAQVKTKDAQAYGSHSTSGW